MIGRFELTSKCCSGSSHRVLVTSVLLVAFLVMWLPSLVLLVLRLSVLEHDEFLNLVLGLPMIVIAYPAWLGALILVATIVDFLQRRGLRAAIRWRILVALLLLGPLALLWYWVGEFRRAMRADCPGAAD